jgi:hypothetical protein
LYHALSKVVSVGIGAQLLQGLLLVPLGVVMFLLSFVVLWIADGLPSHAAVAESALVVNVDGNSLPQGRALTATGPLGAAGAATGDEGWATGGEWIALVRVAETYVWHETVTVESTRHWGGRIDHEYTYEYTTDWASAVPDSSTFEEPGHDNPTPTVTSHYVLADAARMGNATIPQEFFNRLPGFMRVEPSTLELHGRAAAGEHTGYRIYLDGAQADAPSLGDERIVYYGIPVGETATVVGQVVKNVWTPLSMDGYPIFEVIAGDRLDAIEVLHSEDVLRLWVFRIAGFLMMWGGLFLIGSLVYVLLDIIPPLAMAARIAGAIVTLIPAAFLTAVTVGLSIVGHNTLWTAMTLSTMFAGVMALYYVWPPVAQRFGWGRLNRAASSNA